MSTRWSWRAVILAAGVVASCLLMCPCTSSADDEDEPLEATLVFTAEEQRLREERLAEPAPVLLTQREVDQRELDFFRRFTLGMYEQFGRKSPDWDEPARELLELFARHLATTDEAPTAKEFQAAAHPLMTAKCDDPMVLLAVGAVLWGAGDWYEGRKYLEKAVLYDLPPEGATWEQMAQMHQPRLKDYTWLLKWYGKVALGDICHDLRGEHLRHARPYYDIAIYYYAHALKEDWFEPGDERVLYGWIRPHLIGDMATLADTTIREVSRLRRCHPWLQEMILGEAHIQAAWQARGSGWLSTVTPEGAEGFDEHLASAREHLVTAWEMRPEYPHAPTGIVTIEKGRGSPEELHLWFDRAVAAQFDYRPVYHAMLHALKPRWGGSHQAMLRFGDECLGTERFDTLVPDMYWHVAHTLGEDVYEQMPGIWREPGVYEDMERLYEGMLADPDCPRAPILTKTHWAAVAWRCGRLDQARELLEELGDEAVDAVFEKLYRTSAVRARGEIIGLTGPASDHIREVFDLGREDPAAAAKMAMDLTYKVGCRDTSGYLRCLFVDLQVHQALADGDWHDIRPERDLAGWHAACGKWRRTSDRHVSAANEETDALLVLDEPVDGNIAVECYFALPKRRDGSLRGSAGILFGFRQTAPGTHHWFSNHLQLIADTEKVYLSGSQLEDVRTKSVEVQPRNRLRLQIWAGRITCYVNDEPVFRNVQLQPPAQPGLPAHIGIGGACASLTGYQATYREVRLRRLTEPPSWYVVP